MSAYIATGVKLGKWDLPQSSICPVKFFFSTVFSPKQQKKIFKYFFSNVFLRWCKCERRSPVLSHRKKSNLCTSIGEINAFPSPWPLCFTNTFLFFLMSNSQAENVRVTNQSFNAAIEQYFDNNTCILRIRKNLNPNRNVKIFSLSGSYSAYISTPTVCTYRSRTLHDRNKYFDNHACKCIFLVYFSVSYYKFSSYFSDIYTSTLCMCDVRFCNVTTNKRTTTSTNCVIVKCNICLLNTMACIFLTV